MTPSIIDLERRLAIAEHALEKYLGIDLGRVEDALAATNRGATEPAPGEHVAGSIPDPPPLPPVAEDTATEEGAAAPEEAGDATEQQSPPGDPPADGEDEPESETGEEGSDDGAGNAGEPPPAS